MTKKKKRKYKRVSKNDTSRFGVKTALICIAIGTCLIILCSCLSFNIGDWPSKFVFPNNTPPANWCGTVGAFSSYYLLYYIGPGIFVVLISVISLLFAKLWNKQVHQIILRTIGLGLTTVATSMTFQSLWPYKFFGFPMGCGGVLASLGGFDELPSHVRPAGGVSADAGLPRQRAVTAVAIGEDVDPGWRRVAIGRPLSAGKSNCRGTAPLRVSAYWNQTTGRSHGPPR